MESYRSSRKIVFLPEALQKTRALEAALLLQLRLRLFHLNTHHFSSRLAGRMKTDLGMQVRLVLEPNRYRYGRNRCAGDRRSIFPCQARSTPRFAQSCALR